jgi:hypothetical protein
VEINAGMFGDMERIAEEHSRATADQTADAAYARDASPPPSSLAARLLAWMRRLGKQTE